MDRRYRRANDISPPVILVITEPETVVLLPGFRAEEGASVIRCCYAAQLIPSVGS
jgi:hypothetical protein